MTGSEELLIFDIEAEGLLRGGHGIHCIVVRNIDTDEVEVYDGDRFGKSFEEGVNRLVSAPNVIGHNVIGYDIPMLQEVYPSFAPTGDVIDTLVLSRLMFANVKETDAIKQREGMPRHLYGSHALAAWGHRMRCYKGEYDGGWKTYSSEMLDYCIQDTEVTKELFKILRRKLHASA